MTLRKKEIKKWKENSSESGIREKYVAAFTGAGRLK